MLDIYKLDHVHEALHLASPSLCKVIDKQVNEGKIPEKKILKSLFRYLVRMSSRSTPFGLLAGVSLGEVTKKEKSEITISNETNHFPQYRLDMEYLYSIIQHIEKDRNIQLNLNYACNNTVYNQGTDLKFYKQEYCHIKKNIHGKLCSIKSNKTIEYVLQKSQAPTNYLEFVRHLTTNGVSYKKACIFIDKLIENQILISELIAPLTDRDILDNLIQKLERIDHDQTYTPVLKKISYFLKSNTSLIDRSDKITHLLQQHFPDIKHNNLLQGDLAIDMLKNHLEEKKITTIVKQLNELLPLSSNPSKKSLERFTKLFIDRYESRMIPLLEALDPDTGIGYGNKSHIYSSNDDIFKNFDPLMHDASEGASSQHPYMQLVINKYTDAIRDGLHDIQLTSSDLLTLHREKQDNEHLPYSCYAMGSLLSDRTNSAQTLFYMNGFGGISSTNLISRFGYLDKKIDNLLHEVADFEQNFESDSIIAEIIHLPDPRSGNILKRPSFRHAEIPINGQSSNNSICINLKDLYLCYSEGKLILWSLKHKKQVIPRLSTAHNYHFGMSIYRFLADLQFQEAKLQIKWDWGILSSVTYLPRVTYKNIIISRAKWNIRKAILPDFRTLLRENNLPKQVYLIEGDNELLLHLENPICQQTLLEKLKNEDICLEEDLYSYFDSPVLNAAGSAYSNELVIPLVKTYNSKKKALTLFLNEAKRHHTLGSEWIYIQIFTGPLVIERLLKDEVWKLVEDLKSRSIIKNWFFVRYNDPDHHLRLRFEVNKSADFPLIVASVYHLLTPLLDQRIVYDIKYGTYTREIERYSPLLMKDSEKLFTIDSDSTVNLLQQPLVQNSRWLYALQNINYILDSMQLNLMQKINFCEHMQHHFSKEFHGKSYEIHFNNMFRRYKKAIINTLNFPPTFDEGKTKTILTTIREKIETHGQQKKTSTLTKEKVLSSYIHMSINRLFVTEQRKQEYAMYHLLTNYYRLVKGKLKRSSLNYVLDQDIPMRA